VRARARELGIDLARVPAPSGHVTHADLDRHLLSGVQRTAAPNGTAAQNTAPDTTAVPMIGLRRRIAERMVTSLRIPHITYVEEVDVTALVHLRETLSNRSADAPRLTLLPFVARALVIAVAEHPNCNATFADDVEPQLLNTHAAAHIGIATNTPNGLIVPVVRDAQSFGLWGLAAEVNRVTTAARDGSAGRNELSGSTITITSLGALGGLVTTPIINAPEVAIVGINKIHVRPVWDGSAFAPRRMMNMSSSFDHRIVDGWNAAVFVQRIKALLEEPALLFIDAPSD
jgi:2-oxoisovalerate dehydrogenase E2 component (dihydrolipoyl transacylase)